MRSCCADRQWRIFIGGFVIVTFLSEPSILKSRWLSSNDGRRGAALMLLLPVWDAECCTRTLAASLMHRCTGTLTALSTRSAGLEECTVLSERRARSRGGQYRRSAHGRAIVVVLLHWTASTRTHTAHT